jgi:hypothetical protein
MQARIARKKELEAELPGLRERSYALEDQLKERKLHLEYEEGDVAELERSNLKSLFYTVIGKKQEKLNREVDEAEAAKREYEAVAEELAAAQKAVRKAEAELRMLSNCEKEYDTAVREQSAMQKERLRYADPKLLDRINGLEEEIAFCRKLQEQLALAIEEGEKAEYLAEAVLESLRQAADESIHDRNMAMHEELDEAQARLESLQRQLERFNAYLRDREIQADMQIAFTGAARYMDILFDGNDTSHGSHADYSVRIAQHRTEDVATNIRAALGNLREELEKARGRELSAKGAIVDLIAQ